MVTVDPPWRGVEDNRYRLNSRWSSINSSINKAAGLSQSPMTGRASPRRRHVGKL